METVSCERLIASAATCGDFRTQPLDGYGNGSRVATRKEVGGAPGCFLLRSGALASPSLCPDAEGTQAPRAGREYPYGSGGLLPVERGSGTLDVLFQSKEGAERP
jgi:hypothetical protein